MTALRGGSTSGVFAASAWRGARRVALVGLRRPDEHPWTIDAAFDGIENWLRAAGRSVVYRVWQRRRAPDPATYIGRGKAAQLRELCERAAVDGVVVDGTLSRSQENRLSELLGRPVWDRAAWGAPRTPSAAVMHARELARTERRRRGAFTVVLCGGAGAGKSTLFAALTNGWPPPRSSWPAADRTAGPVVVTRRARIVPWPVDVVVTDTPGLIRDPDSAAWTVPEEAIHECRGADLIVHVIDASHPEANRRAREVAAALERAGIRAMMSVWTQADRFPAGFGAAAPWFVSGRTKWGCDHLLASLHRAAMQRVTRDGPVRTCVELARAALV